MDRRREIDMAAFVTDGLRGFTCKLVIGGQDVYLKVSFLRVLEKDAATQEDVPVWKLVHIDITLSAQQAGEEILLTARDARAEVTKTDNARAMIELLFREVNTLLGAEVWADADLVNAWIATRFEPAGVCMYPALRVGEQMERHVGTVKSPLDAAAKFIQSRIVAWQRMLEESHAVVVDPGGDVPAGDADR
jgi:hypothetical protein